MRTTTSKTLTDSQAAHFFLQPDTRSQRQYEALRAYFVERLLSREVASRFGYSPGAFRVLCHQFRHDAGKRAAFFPTSRSGPRPSPARDPIRERVVALRKRNFSVYDIQRELAEAGHTVSINTLSLLLRQEGFARLPRRRDDERPPTVRADPAPVADVRALDLQPRSFRTRFGGLFLFVPLMHDIRLDEVVRQARLPGSAMIPAVQAVRTLLALKLIGKERTSHIMDLVSDEGLALFAGLNTVPKRSYLAAYSYRIDDRATQRLMAAWFNEVQHAGIAKADQAEEIIRFVDFWQQQTGSLPIELVFDSRLTTYSHLDRLNQRGIHFITLRRRTRQMLGAIFSRPASAWQRITLPALTRTFRTPKVLDEQISLRDYAGPLRQVTVTDLGHEEPTILLTNNHKIGCSALVTRYAQRMLIENGISAAVQFFHLDALSSMVGLKVDFDLQITLMASTLYRLLAETIGSLYQHAQPKKLFHNLLDVSATVTIEPERVLVTLDKRAHNPFLLQARLGDQPTHMPWFGDKALQITFS